MKKLILKSSITLALLSLVFWSCSKDKEIAPISNDLEIEKMESQNSLDNIFDDPIVVNIVDNTLVLNPESNYITVIETISSKETPTQTDVDDLSIALGFDNTNDFFLHLQNQNNLL